MLCKVHRVDHQYVRNTLAVQNLNGAVLVSRPLERKYISVSALFLLTALVKVICV